MEWDGVDWIEMAQDRKKWWAFVKAVIKLSVSTNARVILKSWESFSLAPQEGLRIMELAIHVERGLPLYRKSTIRDVLEQDAKKNSCSYHRESSTYMNT